MEAAEEKQKIRQEILAKGRTFLVTVSEVFQVRVTLFVLNTSVRFRKGISCLVDICVCIKEGIASLWKDGSVFSKVKN